MDFPPPVFVNPDRQMIEKMGTTDATKALVVGNSVYDPLVFSRRLVHFSRRQYLFLNSYRLGVPLAEAASKADMTVEQAERFLKRPMTRAWLDDRAKKDYIRNEWHESNKWWEMGDKVLNGERRLSKDQQVVYMAFGERVCPKPRETDPEKVKTVIHFNFSAQDVKEAFRREASFETQVEGDAA